MFRIQLDLRWKLGAGEPLPLDSAMFTLLEAIAESGSLQQAARRAGVSYRHAWGLLGSWAGELGQPLAELARGRGTRLTPLGQALLQARQHVEARLAPELIRLAQEAAQRIEPVGPRALRPLRVHASHDLALIKTRDLLARDHGIDIELTIRGSLESLSALGRRRCEVAGFHVDADQDPGPVVREAVGQSAAERIRVVEMAEREQGLMLRSGRGPAVKSLAELARSGARFINRQRGSGTRALLDSRLGREGVPISDIRGYDDEEFTHLAVAARVASGSADVGFGIRAAAAQFGLAFVPLTVETYYLACHEDRVDAATFERLVACLRSAEFHALCASLPGYDPRHAGRAVRLASPPVRHRRPRRTGRSRPE
jgi:putative molybdopterin biosynthesis protein